MNEHQRRREAQQAAQRQFLNALSAGQAGALDRFANPIQVGQKILYHPPFDLIYEVASVAPVLDPKMAPGMMAVTLTVTFPVHMGANQPNPNAVIVGHVEPQAEQPTDATAAEPAATAPPAESSPIVLVDR